MAYKTDVFEVMTIKYKGYKYPASEWTGLLNLRISSWPKPKNFKVWSVKRLSDGKLFSMYDMTDFGRITDFNTGNAYDEAMIYFEENVHHPVKINELP